jgi:hypothetical protein
LAAPVTLFLDDLVSLNWKIGTLSPERFRRVLLGVLTLVVGVLVIGATGLGAMFFGGIGPGSLSAKDAQGEEFTVSTPELATAIWLRNNVHSPNLVQTDFLGQVLLLSEPGNYGLLPEIVPPDVDNGSYVYLSPLNLIHHISQAATPDGAYQLVYRSNIKFFNRNFYVVYSTGVTRVYH